MKNKFKDLLIFIAVIAFVVISLSLKKNNSFIEEFKSAADYIMHPDSKEILASNKNVCTYYGIIDKIDSNKEHYFITITEDEKNAYAKSEDTEIIVKDGVVTLNNGSERNISTVHDVAMYGSRGLLPSYTHLIDDIKFSWKIKMQDDIYILELFNEEIFYNSFSYFYFEVGPDYFFIHEEPRTKENVQERLITTECTIESYEEKMPSEQVDWLLYNK